jgi:hypothetical protein
MDILEKASEFRIEGFSPAKSVRVYPSQTGAATECGVFLGL